MSQETKNWIAHEPSTYSYLGRNDGFVNWMLLHRKQQGFPPPKTLVLIGSGAIEPFTIAALPLALQSRVVAIEINPELVELGQEIHKGKAILWSDVAKKTQHPGIINTQLTDQKKLSAGIAKLASLGSLANLGPGFNKEFFQVVETVAERVTYISTDALSALKSLEKIDAICDFFVQVNINKDLMQGIHYTKRMVVSAIAALSPNGNYVLGDSGRNMPITLNHIREVPDARLKASALVHVVNQDGKYSSSYYSVLSKNDRPLVTQQTIQQNIDGISQKFELPIMRQTVTLEQLTKLTASHVYFGFIENESGKNGSVWYCPLSIEDAFSKLAPSTDKAFIEQIIFSK